MKKIESFIYILLLLAGVILLVLLVTNLLNDNTNPAIQVVFLILLTTVLGVCGLSKIFRRKNNSSEGMKIENLEKEIELLKEMNETLKTQIK